MMTWVAAKDASVWGATVTSAAGKAQAPAAKGALKAAARAVTAMEPMVPADRVVACRPAVAVVAGAAAWGGLAVVAAMAAVRVAAVVPADPGRAVLCRPLSRPCSAPP